QDRRTPRGTDERREADGRWGPDSRRGPTRAGVPPCGRATGPTETPRARWTISGPPGSSPACACGARRRGGSAVEIDQAELRGREEATRQRAGAAVELGLLEGHVVGLPLRAAGVGVCAREAKLGNCHDCYVLRVSGAGRAEEETTAHRLTWSGGCGF